MEIREPTTMLTDYALAVLGIWLGLRLLRRGGGRRAAPATWWGISFLAGAVAALAGGTSHGFAAHLGDLGHAVAWKFTVYSVGVTALALVVAAALAYLAGTARVVVIAIASADFAIYAWWMVSHDDFRYVVLYYAPALAIVLLLALLAWWSRRDAGAPWTIAGVVVSFLAAAIQQTGWVWHQHFNHNDLYHLVQMAGLYLLYRGGMLAGGETEPAG